MRSQCSVMVNVAMETASRPILNIFRFSTNNSSKLYNIPRKSLSFLPPKNYLSTTSSIGKLYSDGCFVNSSSSFSSSTQDTPPQQLALLLEVEGVLMDVYRLGNCQAFNAAFRKLGLDCANWSQPVYQDLVRKSMGDEERMLVLFFNRVSSHGKVHRCVLWFNSFRFYSNQFAIVFSHLY
uniref:Uncharacterized protein n=1 Tax=Nicotiana tabacum TaxID=4097 RepID=A0A1S3Y0J9_TOBAC|nr:PREDICTED: uncharacterized protein LOC107770681 [Nicotiana tabacum]